MYLCPMTRRELYRKVQAVAVEIYGEQEGCAVADRLTEDIYSFGRFEVVLAGELEVEGFDPLHFDGLMERLRSGEPVQYITGRTEFYGRTFRLKQGVLIPRPETEELVHLIISSCNARAPRILDVGTGSGAIAVSLAAELEGARVEALDLSPIALEVATINARQLGVDVVVTEGDIFRWEPEPESLDVVVSNPPYIPLAERAEMAHNVTEWEPHMALFVPDQSPLLFYERIADVAKVGLREGGELYFEVHERLADHVARMLEERGFGGVRIVNDLNGKPRIVLCRK